MRGTAGRSVRRIAAALALLSFAALACVERPRQEPDERTAALLEDSEIGYTYTSHWGILWKPTNQMLRSCEYSAVCRSGRIEVVTMAKIWDGSVKQLSRGTVSARRYLELWRAMEEVRVWELTSKDYDELQELLKKNLTEAAARFLEETWAVVSTCQDHLRFSLRIKDRIHKISVYDAPGLRDATYWRVFLRMSRFFGKAPRSLRLADQQSYWK